LTFAFSVFLAVWVSRTVRFLLRDEILPNMSLPRGVANSVSSLTYYLLIIGGLAVALVASGFEVGQLAFAIGALGVGIGLGLQDVVRNFVSGLILMFERPIQPGDVIDVGGTAGKVRVIGMRATTLATFDGAEVVVPNGMLLAEKLTNWTLSNMNRRFEVKLGVAYGTDPKRVLDLVMETTRGTPGIADHPAPVVLFSGMGSSSLDFTLQAWTNNYSDWLATRSDLTVRLHDALVGAGIEIPFPQQDLRIRSVSPEAKSSLSSLTEPPAAK
jgi:small-conductance mechanosensitive channel